MDKYYSKLGTNGDVLLVKQKSLSTMPKVVDLVVMEW
jgi:hypothetical protein